METCKSCGSTHLWKHGVKDGSQQWMCADCHRTPCDVDRRILYKRRKKNWQLSFIWMVLALEESLESLQRCSALTVMRWMAQAGQKIEQEEIEFQNKIEANYTENIKPQNLTLKKLL